MENAINWWAIAGGGLEAFGVFVVAVEAFLSIGRPVGGHRAATLVERHASLARFFPTLRDQNRLAELTPRSLRVVRAIALVAWPFVRAEDALYRRVRFPRSREPKRLVEVAPVVTGLPQVVLGVVVGLATSVVLHFRGALAVAALIFGSGVLVQVLAEAHVLG